jgi:hypothetical protein
MPYYGPNVVAPSRLFPDDLVRNLLTNEIGFVNRVHVDDDSGIQDNPPKNCVAITWFPKPDEDIVHESLVSCPGLS